MVENFAFWFITHYKELYFASVGLLMVACTWANRRDIYGNLAEILSAGFVGTMAPMGVLFILIGLVPEIMQERELPKEAVVFGCLSIIFVVAFVIKFKK